MILLLIPHQINKTLKRGKLKKLKKNNLLNTLFQMKFQKETLHRYLTSALTAALPLHLKVYHHKRNLRKIMWRMNHLYSY